MTTSITRRIRAPIVAIAAVAVALGTATWLISSRVKATATTGRAEAAAVAPERSVETPLAHHRAALAAHARERDDPPWARAAEAAIGKQLAALAREGRFAVVGTRCRSASCVATVEWPSYPDAESNWSAVLRGNYGECGVAVILDPAAAGTGRFRNEVFFDCSRRSKTPNQHQQSEIQQ
jgi:hypothetical protein